ncbi:hypothetical protein B0T22DRAFT_235876 [Podospora appendiculata]|uniref:Uncharacterized protein n=1 Tax=Podospora appendiculata TaxID=314037 RepID=A0AAE0X6C2_9PEZI|nr:hypothetical protein B0T22DRAFT_235876 [Podospora appendiculata]
MEGVALVFFWLPREVRAGKTRPGLVLAIEVEGMDGGRVVYCLKHQAAMEVVWAKFCLHGSSRRQHGNGLSPLFFSLPAANHSGPRPTRVGHPRHQPPALLAINGVIACAKGPVRTVVHHEI